MKKKLFVVPAVLGTIGTFLTPYVLFKRFIGRFIIKDEMNLGKEWMPYKTELTVKYDELKALPHESVKIESFDKLILHANFYKAGEQSSNKTLIVFHGFRGLAIRDFAMQYRFYMDMGYNLLIVDMRAHGESEGRYTGFGVLDSLDCVSWCEYIECRFGKEHKVVLHGTSMGAAAVMMACGRNLPDIVKAVIEDCGFTDIEEEFKNVLGNTPVKVFFIKVASIYSKIFAGYSFKEYKSTSALRKAKIPVLFIHGGSDDFVPTYMVRELYESCPTDKDMLIVDCAGHTMSYVVDKQAYEAKVKSFLEKI